MHASRLCCLAAASLFVTSPSALGQSAKVTESLQSFRTYPFGDPNPMARMGTLYPYFRFEGYSTTWKEQAWKVVTLENPYIRVLIAPELGGKILGAYERSTGEAFLYSNKVVKFREIAMRGPWTSGGIEFNFGDIGHAPSTSTPVDYLTRANPDGSVSCFVGAMDLHSRTVWRVEIRLPKDRAYFETHSFWYNPTSEPTSLYHWMNAAAPAALDLQFVYPGTATIDHGGNVFDYPNGPEGRDLSRYADNAFGSHKSYHVLGTRTDFFGAYYTGRDFGVIHWSRYEDKPGKKIWLWSQARDGAIWTNLLTDPELGNGQYVEIQSGLLFNQAGSSSTSTPFKHQFLAPHSQVRFTEAWFPVMNTGGVVEANLSGALNVVRRGSQVTLTFCPVRPIDDVLEVMAGKSEVFSKGIRLRPLEPYRAEFEAPEGEFLTVSLGKDLLTYREGETSELQRPTVAPQAYDWESPSGLALRGAEEARQRNVSQALAYLERCLEKDPYHLQALALSAQCRARRGQWTEALALAKRALAIDAYDGDANFMYGVINRNLSLLVDARDGFAKAARTPEYRSAAVTELAEIALMEKRWEEAEHFASEAVALNHYDIRARRVLALTSRITRNSEKALAELDGLETLDPLDHFARFERYLHSPTTENKGAFTSGVRSELPHETFLELAVDYAELNLAEEAALVLEFSPSHPIVSYWKAYLAAKVGEDAKSRQDLASALEASPALVFPHRAETGEVLTWAESQSPHWKTKYYLGLLAWSRGLGGEAARHFAACGDQPDFAPFYVNRAVLSGPDSPSNAERDYRKAIAAGPGEWRTYRALGAFYNSRHEYAKGLTVFREGALKSPSSYVMLFDYAQSLLYNHRYDECLAILDTLVVLPFEGAGYSRQTYREACVLSALSKLKAGDADGALALVSKARQWPEHLGVGRPYSVDETVEDYIQARCEALSGKDATELFQRVADRPVAGSSSLLSAASLRHVGKDAVGARLLDAVSARDSASILARWSVAAYQKGPLAAEDLLKRSLGSDGGWYTFPSDPDFLLVHSVVMTIGLEEDP